MTHHHVTIFHKDEYRDKMYQFIVGPTYENIVVLDQLYALKYRWLADGGLVIYEDESTIFTKPLDRKCFFLESTHEVTTRFKQELVERGLELI